MAANTAPIFPLSPKAGWGTLTTANTAKDGTGTVATVYTAGANGGYVESVRLQPLGTNVASVARVFLNNGSPNAIASNNTLWYEIALPATTLTETGKMQVNDVVLSLNRSIPTGYKVNVVIGTTVAAGWQATANAGDY